MPTYADLLRLQEWKLMRNHVYRNAGKKCARCRNARLIPNLQSTRSIDSPDNKSGCMVGRDENELIYLRKDSWIAEEVLSCNRNSLADLMIYYRKLTVTPYNPNLILLVRTITGTNWEDYEWKYVRDIDIHHLYYQLDCDYPMAFKKPWDYPISAFKALCNPCHMDLHNEESIPILNTSHYQIGTMTPCPRCTGTGRMNEYDYYQGGVCFCCQGARYIELMEPNQLQSPYCWGA